MPNPVTVDARTIAYSKRGWWLRVPTPDGRAHVILSLPRDQLVRGYAQYEHLRVVVDYDSLYHDGHGYTADVRIEDSIGDKRTLDPGARL